MCGLNRSRDATEGVPAIEAGDDTVGLAAIEVETTLRV